MLDFEIQRCTRRCAATDRRLEPGERFYSVLKTADAGQVLRVDFSASAWTTPPEDAIAWWQAQIADESSKPKLAPSEVMLRLFDEWGDTPEQADARYVLTLLMLRRKIFRPTESFGLSESNDTSNTPDQTEQLAVYCPPRDDSYTVQVVVPDAERAAEIDNQLNELLFAASA